MARADGSITNDVNESEIADTETSSRMTAKLSSASFRSATSYASFRSCKSIKSYNSSFKSAVSRGNSYNSYNFYSCEDQDHQEGDGPRAGLVNEGYQDNVSFYSCNDVEMSPKSSIVSVTPRLRSVSDSVLHQYNDDKWSQDSINQEKERTTLTSRYLACLAVMAAGVAVAASVYVQHLAPKLPPWVVMIYRSLIQLSISICMLMVTKCNPLGPSGTRWRLLVSGLLNCFLILTLYLTVTKTPMNLSATILMMTPVVTTLLSSFLCREHIGMFRLLLVCIYISGILLVTRPPPMFVQNQDTWSPLHVDLAQHNIYGYPAHFLDNNLDNHLDVVGGVLAGVATVVIGSIILILNRQCKEASFSVVLFWSSLGSLSMSSIGLYVLGQSENHDVEIIREGREIPDDSMEDILNNTTEAVLDKTSAVIFKNRMFEGTVEWLVATLISFLGIFATIIMIKALQYIHPGKASLIQTTQVLAAYILVTSISSMSGLEWLDLAGVILVIFTILAVFLEDKIVDIKRWRWF